MADVDWTSRDLKTLRDMVIWWRTQVQEQPIADTQFNDTLFASIFETGTDGLPPFNDSTGKPGSEECQPIRIDDNDDLFDAGTNTELVYNYSTEFIARYSKFTAVRDVDGRWIAIPIIDKGYTAFALTNANGIDAASDRLTPASAECEIRYFDGTEIKPFDPPVFDHVFNSCLGAIKGDIIIQIHKIDGYWFAVVVDCNQ